MPDDLLAVARLQAEQADLSVQAGGLLRIARVESVTDAAKAIETLRRGLDHVRQLPGPDRRYLMEEARFVAAAVAPELLAEIPSLRSGARDRFIEGRIVEVMLQHGHVDTAFDYLMHYDDPAGFPFRYIGNLLHHLRPDISGYLSACLENVTV